MHSVKDLSLTLPAPPNKDRDFQQLEMSLKKKLKELGFSWNSLVLSVLHFLETLHEMKLSPAVVYSCFSALLNPRKLVLRLGQTQERFFSEVNSLRPTADTRGSTSSLQDCADLPAQTSCGQTKQWQDAKKKCIFFCFVFIKDLWGCSKFSM